jgi:ATP-dependent DNA helicase RecG
MFFLVMKLFGLLKKEWLNCCPRNPLLFTLLHRIHLTEEAGSGLVRIDMALTKQGLAKAKIEATQAMFRVTFMRKDLQGSFEGSGTTPKLLAIIRENPSISKKEIALKLGITVDGVKYQLKKLKGQVKWVGGSKNGRWEIIK